MRRYWLASKNRLFLNAHCGDIGVGLVGVGGWGATNAVALMQSRRFSIEGVYDTDRELAQKFARRHQTQIFNNYEALLAQAGIVAVVLTVPNHLHADMVKQAAASGKHVFIEKPLASTPDTCRLLEHYCRERQVVLLVGHQLRREPAFREIKRLIRQGGLGRPLFAQGIRTLRCTTDDWRRDPKSCPGGSMEQLGLHLIDVMIYLFGEPREWTGWCRNIPFCRPKPDWGHVTIHFAGDVSGTVDSSFSSPDRLEFNLFCENGQLRYDGKHLALKQDREWKRLSVPGGSGSVAQFVEFAECIKGQTTPETDAKTAKVISEIVFSMQSLDERV